MSIATKVLRTDGLTVDGSTAMLRIGLPWYRSLPWASVAGVAVNIDGTDLGVPSSIDGSRPDQLKERSDYWSIHQWADVRFDSSAIPVAGDEVSVRLRVDLRIPGPLSADGGPMPYRFEAVLPAVVGSHRTSPSDSATSVSSRGNVSPH
ncbi:hypothetical protein [Microbacterium enclense]|uniref:hypothetical protein n=1 Tax=Microbacterium enclense TaxID=993073 RepID=UPI003D71C732